MSEEEQSNEIDRKNMESAEKIKKLLLRALGTDGLLIRDNEVEFLIDILDNYIEMIRPEKE